MSQATVTKPAKAKPANASVAQKPAQKPATAKALPFAATLYSAIIAKKFGSAVFAYYKRAADYHKAQGTVFPRSRNNDKRSELFGSTVAESKRKANAEAIIARCVAGTLAAGHQDGQALYDQMRIDADAAGITWPLTN